MTGSIPSTKKQKFPIILRTSFHCYIILNLLKPTGHVMHQQFNPLNTKRRLLYLKTQFLPRSKHFSSRL